jgi:hypothetical protein
LTKRRLDDTGDARCDVVLKLEDVFEQAVEAVGPEMRAGCASISCAVMPTRFPPLRTEPSST